MRRCTMQQLFCLMLILCVIGCALAVTAASIAATVSAIPAMWFVPGDLLVVGCCIVIVWISGFGFVEQVRWILRRRNHQSTDDDDDLECDCNTKPRRRPNRFDIPHPQDPRLSDVCMLCLEPLKRDVLSTRMAVLEDGSVALGVYEETLMRPCDQCGYALHACCALACLARSHDCILCKQPLIEFLKT